MTIKAAILKANPRFKDQMRIRQQSPLALPNVPPAALRNEYHKVHKLPANSLRLLRPVMFRLF